MIFVESEKEKVFCPWNNFTNCLAASCAAWVWDEDEYEYMIDTETAFNSPTQEEREDAGWQLYYCGPIAKRYKRDRLNRRGHCGRIVHGA